MANDRNPLVYMNISVNGAFPEQIIIELLKNYAPRTAENFRALCTDFGGESIYGRRFEDENFVVKHYCRGLLSMENDHEPNTNGSRFLITFNALPLLDRKHVVFGKVVQRMDVVRKIEEVPTTYSGKPKCVVIITECGELPYNGRNPISYSRIQSVVVAPKMQQSEEQRYLRSSHMRAANLELNNDRPQTNFPDGNEKRGRSRSMRSRSRIPRSSSPLSVHEEDCVHCSSEPEEQPNSGMALRAQNGQHFSNDHPNGIEKLRRSLSAHNSGAH